MVWFGVCVQVLPERPETRKETSVSVPNLTHQSDSSATSLLETFAAVARRRASGASSSGGGGGSSTAATTNANNSRDSIETRYLETPPP